GRPRPRVRGEGALYAEAEPFVEPVRPLVRRGHRERRAREALLAEGGEREVDERSTQPAALRLGAHRDLADVAIAARQPARDQPPERSPGADGEARGLRIETPAD